MGYLLKQKNDGVDTIKVFYSKPIQGYYAGFSNNLSIEEYRDYGSDLLHEDYVFINNGSWCDVSAGKTNEAYGVFITEYLADCILQGKKLPFDEPIEFGVSKANH